jgi:hypothetical protein
VPRLLISKSGSFQKVYEFSDRDIITIGRSPANDIFLTDARQKISRYHAAIARSLDPPGCYFLRDLSSLHPARLGGEVTCQRILKDTDVIEIGDYELTYSDRFSDRRTSRLRVVPKPCDVDTLGATTILVTDHEIFGQDPRLSSERRELIEQLVLSANRGSGLAGLLRDLILGILRVTEADRGFVALFQDGHGDLFEDVSSVGLVPGEQIDISDESFAEKLLAGQCVQDRTTLLVPILREKVSVGFFCLARRPPADPFQPADVAFLLALGRLIGDNIPGSNGPPDTPSLDNVVEWAVDMVGTGEKMGQLRREIAEGASTELNVLIFGESGTGKELVAKAIHMQSSQSKGPFLARNCAAITESLAETEIFGYAPKSGISEADPKGAPGWFEMANGGTLFLDEIQSLSPPIQDKFLRVLQDKEVWRVRAREPVRVNVKVLAATDSDLERAVEAGDMRKALYHRFGKRIRLRPLRERREDIPLLTHFFLDKCARRSRSKTRSVSHLLARQHSGVGELHC